MTMTDPIADMLTRLRNANSAYHDTVAMPASKIKTHIAEILQQEGYIGGWNVEENTDSPGQTMTLTLKYGPNRERSIAGVRRVSKPGLRVDAGDRRHGLPRAGPWQRPRVRARVQPPGDGPGPGRDHLHRRGADEVRRLRHRQAEGRRDRGQHPQDP